MNKYLKRDLFCYILICAVVFIFYGNTLSNGFVYDDPIQIANFPLVQDIGNLPKIVYSCLLGISKDTDCNSIGLFYRPLALITNLITNQISKDPWIFHLRSLILSSVVSFLLYKFFQVLLEKRIYAVIAVMLVLINPINSEIVNFVSAVHDQLMAIFLLLAFLTYLKFSKTNKLKFLIFSGIFYLLALIAKETVITLFLLMPVYELLFTQAKKKTILKKYVLIFGVYILAVVIYFFLRSLALTKEIIESKGYHDLNFYQSILTGIAVYPALLFKLIYPLPLNAQHDPLVIRVFNPQFLIYPLFWLLNITAAYIAYKKKLKLVLFGLAIIFLSMLPMVAFIDRVGRFTLAERWLFLPSVSWSIILIYLSSQFLKKVNPKSMKRTKNILIGVLLIYSLISLYIVFNRNLDWKDEFTFNKSIAKYAKENFGVHYNLGVNYSQRGELDLAVESYKKALVINPEFWQAHNNLANAYLNKDLIDQAINEFKQVTSLNPDLKSRKTALNNLLLLKSGTESAKLTLEAGDIRYQDDTGLSFKYPIFFRLEERKDSIALTQEDIPFVIEISLKNSGFSDFEAYTKSQKQSFGTLINQGLAQIPNFDQSYARVWDPVPDGTGQKLEFFLFKGGKAVNILVYPANSELMVEFDKLIGSIKIE